MIVVRLCGEAGPADFRNQCVRDSWSAFVPAVFVFALCFYRLLPIPGPLKKLSNAVKKPFEPYLTLSEAEALDAAAAAGDKVNEDEDATGTDHTLVQVSVSRSIVMSGIAVAQTLVWLGIAYFQFVTAPNDRLATLRPALVGFSWSYAAVRPAIKLSATPPADLFSIYLIHLISGSLLLFGVIYDHNVFGDQLPPTLVLVALTANLLSVIVLLTAVVQMPFAVPSKRVNLNDIGFSVTPEDYTSLWEWLTFNWVYPLVRRGTKATLNEKDIWGLSPTMQSRPLFIKFGSIHRRTLLRRLWAANSLDIILDLVLTYVSIAFNYAGPFFLRRILEAIDSKDSSPDTRAKGYIFAFLAFICSILKAQADAQHLWYGRRAGTRIRSELMAAIYDKALKRKDYSGIVDPDKQMEAAGRRTVPPSPVSSMSTDILKPKVRVKSEDEPKAGADVGKIVNLMAGDANRIAQMITGFYLLAGAPLEIFLAGAFLYQILGVSAFAGFVVLMAGWPVNSFVTKRSIRIQKGILAARDKRMGVLNELIGAVKFIKFFAWEERWIQRALDARGFEMQWLFKGRINNVMFNALWTSAPILVSIISFFTYVAQGNELTVSTAFTSIALFNMIRTPLNVIPTWIVQILQTKVALDRISTYIAEDEVTEQVSTLKKSRCGPTSGDDEETGLGIENGSFKWNEVEEVPEQPTAKDPDHTSAYNADSDTAIETQSMFSDMGDRRFELRNISVMFPDGELTCITGPTASGKTALLMATLGEMTMLSGRLIMSKNPSKVDRHGLMHSISYASQSPWLRHQSIRENILFGYPYDEERYNAVVECCALKTDLSIFEDGDATEIGARGVSLSGGQKARVALARAVYARTKYVLLDDPLSAVDSHTARFLFDRLFRGPLLANRTVILVTHHVELVLPGTYYLVRMLDGRIDTQGTVKDLRARGVLDDFTHGSAALLSVEKEFSEPTAHVDGESSSEDAGKGPEDSRKPRKFVKEEHRETGGVKWSIYKAYLKASSYWIWSFLCFMVVLAQLLGVVEKLWIKTWGEAYGEDMRTSASYAYKSFAAGADEISMHGPVYHHSIVGPFQTQSLFGVVWPSAFDHPLFYIGVYSLIGLATAVTAVISTILQYTGALRASRILFEQLLATVVRATMRWHDVTPQGRMLNRFGKDVETIDLSLATSLQAVNLSLASFFAAIITVAVVFPMFLFPAILIGLVYRSLAVGYLSTGRDLRRMESNTRSPIFSGFSELLEGIVTVRAFSAEQRFLDGLHEKIDLTTQMWYTFWMMNRWLLLNFDALGALSVLITTLFALSGYVNAGMAGLSITSSMTFTMSVYWACRFWTGLELDLNSVERIVEYLDLPQEPPAIIESNRPPAYWPSSSNKDSLIVAEDVVVKYSPELPSVLHGVSFSLRAGERVGLLGRTGSGKSTLAMSILRFVDPVSGRILIDGIDISKIGVHDLRSRLTFIPQDAALFSGTLRDNLDPFGDRDDGECLDALYRVQMLSQSAYTSQRTSRAPSRASSIHGVELDQDDAASLIAPTVTDTEPKTKISLDTQVSPGGTNFSQGQRQLIAMARALLRRSSIVVLDEATSSIDFATDAKIQATIREEFNDSLLLTVAHRLRTVIDYDRLLILDKGQLVEFDTPLRLIQKENGIFRQMCLKSGSFTDLENAARAKAERDANGR